MVLPNYGTHSPFSYLASHSAYRKWLYHVSFSPDGHHLAYGGDDNKLTLWSVKDIAPQLSAPILPEQSGRRSTQQETRLNSPSSSCLDADATWGDGITEERHDNPYNNFFQSSRESLPSASLGFHLPQPFSVRRFLNVFSRHHPPADESIPGGHSKRGFFARRARSNLSLELATMKLNQPVRDVKVRAGYGEQCENVDRVSANDALSARKDIGKQQDEPLSDAQIIPSDDPTHPDDLDSKDNRNLWKRIMRAQGKDLSDTNISPAMKRPEVVEVYAVRGFQRHVAMKRVCKTKIPAVMCSAPLAAAHASGSSQLEPSLQALPVQTWTSSHAVVGNGAPYSQATGCSLSNASNTSPSYFVTNYHTNHDSDSRSSIEGSCNRFLNKICFPFGRYHNDS